jgi:hypothetical protein
MKKPITGRIILCLLIALFVGAAALLRHRKSVREGEESIKSAVYAFSAVDTTKSRHTDIWWLRKDPGANLEAYYLLEAKKNAILRLINQSRHISADTERLAARFQEIKVGIIIPPSGGPLPSPGLIRYLGPGNESGLPKGQEIGFCFVPEEAAMSSLMYQPLWNSRENLVALSAVDIPEKILTGIIYHELGHAYIWNKATGKDLFLRKPKGSTENVFEEVTMHKMAGTVMDVLVSGRYSKFVDKIARRNLGEPRLDKAIASITLDERDELESMFECQKSEVGKKLLGSQCVLLIGFRLAALRHEGVDGEVEVYRKVEFH